MPPWPNQHSQPLGSHQPRQEDLDAVDKALRILAVDDRTYCEPLFSFVQARIQGLQAVLDVLTRSGSWVPALSDEQLHDLVTGLASKKAPAEVLEEIRRRYVYPRCVEKGKQKAGEESNLGHWDNRAREMTDFMAKFGHCQMDLPPPELQYPPPIHPYRPPLAQQYDPPAQYHRAALVQPYQPTLALSIGTHTGHKRDEGVKEEEGSTDPTDIEAVSSCSPFPAYEEAACTYASQGLASQGVGMANPNGQHQPSATFGTGIDVGEGGGDAVRGDEPVPNMANNGAGAPYRAIYAYARGIPSPSPHGSTSEGAGRSDHHGQAVIPPPPTPTWSESTTGPQTHLVRGHSDSLHLGSPSPLPSFFTGAVTTEPNIQPDNEVRRDPICDA